MTCPTCGSPAKRVDDGRWQPIKAKRIDLRFLPSITDVKHAIPNVGSSRMIYNQYRFTEIVRHSHSAYLVAFGRFGAAARGKRVNQHRLQYHHAKMVKGWAEAFSDAERWLRGRSHEQQDRNHDEDGRFVKTEREAE